MVKKKHLILTVSITPQAYVMPDEPELSDAEYEELSDDEFRRRIDRYASFRGFKYDTDPVQDAIESEELREWDDMDDDDVNYSLLTDIEKAAAPIIAEAVYADFLLETPHDPAAYGVEIDGDQEALKMLIVAVAVEVGRWTKPPKAEVTAAGIGLAVAHIRKERNVKHPRDVAREVGVRPQTLFAVRKLALQEIQRLNLADDLVGDGAESAGTYNQSETERSSPELE